MLSRCQKQTERDKNMTFTFKPAENGTVDSEYVLDANSNITIQDCRSYGAGWAVNEHGYDVEGDEYSLWMRDHGFFKTLKAAKAKAISIAQ